MKEELLRVISTKLDDININIASLNDLNGKIGKAEEDLTYIEGLLDRFVDDNQRYNVLNFTKLSKDDFDSVLGVVRSDISDVFKTNNCNYDGLIYLINGINNGVSLSLTIEQENAINYLIQAMDEVKRNEMAVVDGLNLVKANYVIDDVDELEKKKDRFESIVTKINDGEYVDEIDDIKEAMEFNGVDSDMAIGILVYLLNYNAEIYKTRPVTVKEEIYEEKVKDSEPVEEHIVDVPPVEEEKNDELEFHLPEFSTIEVPKSPQEYDLPFVPEIDNDEVKEEKEETKTEEDIILPPIEEYHDEVSNVEPEAVEDEPVIPEIPSEDVKVETPIVEEEQVEVPEENATDEIVSDNDFDADFNDIISQEDYDEEKTISEPVDTENVKTSTREVQRLFQEFDIKVSDDELNQYVDGNIDEYRKIIKIFKDNGVLNKILEDHEIFKEILVNSKENDIINVLEIIKNELSVDSEDYEDTMRIAVDTIPSIFVNHGGNYENFVENVKLYKDLGINLVNLFDFSKEVLIANHEMVLANYEVVKKYNVSIDYKTAKYFLLLNNVVEKMDYYVEAVYKDKTKGDTFDGINLLNNYPSKLNMVSDLTIKRLRYSSENGKKIFGSKPNSLTGEITNLKVNVLDIPNDYMEKFFNNKFDSITNDEMRQYIKLCRNSSNVGDYADELSFLEQYHDSLRYNIQGIKVSYNKVVRNYNILRSYGIEVKKALEFAVCYNLVITTSEYQTLKTALNEGVGE